MANKQISDLTTRSGGFDDTVMFPVDDATQTWKLTGAQLREALVPDQSFVTKTTTASLTAAQLLALCDGTGGAFTLTLAPAADTEGKRITITKIGTDYNAITVDGDGAEVIDFGNGAAAGASSTTLNTPGESIELISNGTKYYLIKRNIPSVWTAFTPTIGAITSAPTQGSGATKEARWRRIGDSMEINFNYNQSNAGSGGTGNYLFPLPSGFTIDSAKLTPSTDATLRIAACGVAQCYNGAGTPGYMRVYDTSNLHMAVCRDDQALIHVGSSFGGLGITTMAYTYNALVPISGWKG